MLRSLNCGTIEESGYSATGEEKNTQVRDTLLSALRDNGSGCHS